MNPVGNNSPLWGSGHVNFQHYNGVQGSPQWMETDSQHHQQVLQNSGYTGYQMHTDPTYTGVGINQTPEIIAADGGENGAMLYPETAGPYHQLAPPHPVASYTAPRCGYEPRYDTQQPYPPIEANEQGQKVSSPDGGYYSPGPELQASAEQQPCSLVPIPEYSPYQQWDSSPESALIEYDGLQVEQEESNVYRSTEYVRYFPATKDTVERVLSSDDSETNVRASQVGKLPLSNDLDPLPSNPHVIESGIYQIYDYVPHEIQQPTYQQQPEYQNPSQQIVQSKDYKITVLENRVVKQPADQSSLPPNVRIIPNADNNQIQAQLPYDHVSHEIQQPAYQQQPEYQNASQQKAQSEDSKINTLPSLVNNPSLRNDRVPLPPNVHVIDLPNADNYQIQALLSNDTVPHEIQQSAYWQRSEYQNQQKAQPEQANLRDLRAYRRPKSTGQPLSPSSLAANQPSAVFTGPVAEPIVNLPGRSVRQRVVESSDYKCEICGSFFVRLSGLMQHNKWIHSDRNFPCLRCGKKFRSAEDLAQHQLQHDSLNKPFKCNVCNKRFCHSIDLRRHSFCHSNETPFRCNRCFKEFTRNDHLALHHKSHERRDKIKLEKAKIAKSAKPTKRTRRTRNKLTSKTVLQRTEGPR